MRIRHLLTHTSGLPAYTDAKALKDLYGSPCPDKVIEKICSLKAQSEPGQEFRYSCLGYITLAQIVRIVTGQSVDEFSQANVFAPLGMSTRASIRRPHGKIRSPGRKSSRMCCCAVRCTIRWPG